VSNGDVALSPTDKVTPARGPLGRWRSLAGRLTWGLADQAVSSLTNFAVGIVVARSLGPTEFGAFGLAWVTYGVVLNLSRGLTTDAFVVRFSGAESNTWRAAVAQVSGSALLLGTAAGGLSVLAGILVGGSVGGAFVGLGLVLPALMLQDSWRYAFFAAGRGRSAFANDLVWAVALVPALLVAAQEGSVLGFVVAWGVAAAVAAGYGWAQSRVRPRPSESWRWLVEHRQLGVRYMLENVSISGASQVRMYGLGALAGLAAVGTVRGAELLLGPFMAVLMGLSNVAVPEASRVLKRRPGKLPLFCLVLGGTQAGLALLWGLGLLFLLPDAWGRFVLGDVWQTASTLILPATLSVMSASISTGAAAGVRALGASRLSLRAQSWASLAYATGGLVGAAVDGARGSAWGVASATFLGAVVWWLQLRAGLHQHRHPSHPPTIHSRPTMGRRPRGAESS
jgi:O-antigen/teichoic acid export membrane protein